MFGGYAVGYTWHKKWRVNALEYRRVPSPLPAEAIDSCIVRDGSIVSAEVLSLIASDHLRIVVDVCTG